MKRSKNNQHIIENTNSGFSSRFRVIAVLFIVIAAVIFLKLFWLQVVDAESLSTMASAQRIEDYSVHAKRGTIYDRNGKILAKSVDAVTITANPKSIVDASATSDVLAKFLGGKASDYFTKLTKPNTAYSVIERRVDKLKGEALKAEDERIQKELAEWKSSEGQERPSNPLRGIFFQADQKRIYPYGGVAGQVIGTLDIDGNGTSGLELQYNDLLKGTDGYVSSESSEGGKIPMPNGDVVKVSTQDGSNIKTTIDIVLQQYLEAQLKKEHKASNSKSGNAVIIDAGTGEVYACAATPALDLTKPEKIKSDSLNLRSVSFAYEPGSTFKAVTAAALIEEGLAKPKDKIFVPSSLTIYDKTITDAHYRESGKMTFSEIMSESSNIGISLLEKRLGKEKLYDYIVKFGFDTKTGIEFPGEAEGILNEPKLWPPIQEKNISFGQGISVSSLQTCAFYASIENDGTWIRPHIIQSIPSKGEYTSAESKVVMKKSTTDTLKKMLEKVVNDGTAQTAQIKGFDVVGKTGTAQIAAEGGGYVEDAYYISFAGFIANSNSNLTCFVGFEKPETAPAIPVFNKVMKFAIGRYGIVSE